MQYALTKDTPIGPLTLVEAGGVLIRLCFGRLPDTQTETPLLCAAFAQLDEYFSGQRKCFDLPLCPHGTPFQLACWQALCAIPYGETRTYAQQAAQVGNPKACRAVGMANHRNPLPILIPCHRVVGSDGSLTGYAGGIDTKRFLLELEQKG